MDHPPTAGSAPPPRRSGPAWGKIIGFGCGGCALVALLLALLFATAIRQLLHKTPLSPSALPYAGDWQAQDGTTLSIRADGSGRYHGGNTSIDGGQVKIDPTTRTLEIGLFGIKKRWHIDQPPRNVRGTTIMKLDGMVYRRTASPHRPGSRRREAEVRRRADRAEANPLICRGGRRRLRRHLAA